MYVYLHVMYLCVYVCVYVPCIYVCLYVCIHAWQSLLLPSSPQYKKLRHSGFFDENYCEDETKVSVGVRASRAVWRRCFSGHPRFWSGWKRIMVRLGAGGCA